MDIMFIIGRYEIISYDVHLMKSRGDQKAKTKYIQEAESKLFEIMFGRQRNDNKFKSLLSNWWNHLGYLLSCLAQSDIMETEFRLLKVILSSI